MDNFIDFITTFVTSMDFIDWGIPGVLFFILHFVIKSEIIKWTGVGAMLVSLTSLIEYDLGWQGQWITFFIFIIWGLYRNRGADV